MLSILFNVHLNSLLVNSTESTSPLHQPVLLIFVSLLLCPFITFSALSSGEAGWEQLQGGMQAPLPLHGGIWASWEQRGTAAFRQVRTEARTALNLPEWDQETWNNREQPYICAYIYIFTNSSRKQIFHSYPVTQKRATKLHLEL